MRINNHKQDFSIFKNFKDKYGKELIYLDSAASSLTPDAVVEKISEYYTEYRSNIDRSEFVLGQLASSEYENSRKVVASFIGAEDSEIIFTSGATDSYNKLLRMLIPYIDLSKGDTVLVSESEHHAVLVATRELLEPIGVKIIYITKDAGGRISTGEFEKLLEQRPKLVTVGHANNITGTVEDLGSLFRLARGAGAFCISDASQTAGHMDIDVEKLHVDALFFSAHKMCGPTGTGVLYIKESVMDKLSPAVYGGGIVSSVSESEINFRTDVKRFEAGTQNISGVIGLGKAVEYMESIGIGNINKHTLELHSYAFNKLQELSFIKIAGSAEVTSVNSGIISFSVDGVHSHDVAHMLGESGVAVRSGYHCSEIYSRKLSEVPLLRISFYLYNTKSDIDFLVLGLSRIYKIFNK